MTVKRVVVVIPAYNEEQTIVEVIRGLKQRGFTTLIVVDDGSSDRTGELASDEGVIRLRHLLNRGLGGALGTGISAALRLGAEVIVTFDADGQHDPNDITRLLQPIEVGEAEVVIGSRLLDPRGMPYRRRLANWIANVVTYLLFGGWTITTTASPPTTKPQPPPYPVGTTMPKRKRTRAQDRAYRITAERALNAAHVAAHPLLE